MPGQDGDEVWLSSKAAAEHLGLHHRTLYRLIDEGQLPAYQFRKAIRLRRCDVDAFIERQRIVPGTVGHLHP